MISLIRYFLFAVFCFQLSGAENHPPPFNVQGQPNRNRPGPWDNDVLIYRADKEGEVVKLATFPRAGVPTLARFSDHRLVAAHQYFPADNDADFDKVAVLFSSNEGKNWTPPQVIQLKGLPEGMRFPFDPTLVPLPDGQVRLYFTSLKGRRFEEDRPAIYSAISSNSIDFFFEPGVRFGVEGRLVIDCAVALHVGVFHLFAPDNGTRTNPGPNQREAGEGPRRGVGYYARSKDGLNFTRQSDVQIGGDRRWLGNAQSDGKTICFFGTGGPGGVWMATSTNGQSWNLNENFPRIQGADPGAVKLKDGGWLLAVTGPPRGNRDQGGPNRELPNQFPPRLMTALDTNRDGVIDEKEIENAPAALRKLDHNKDGKLAAEELRPAPTTK